MKLNVRTYYAIFIVGVAAAACGQLQKPQNETESGPSYDVSTEIVKGPTSNVLASSILEMEFALGGKDATNPNLTFENFSCKFKGQEAYRACNSKPFTVSGLKDGEDYQIAVRGNLKQKDSGVAVVTPDTSLTFRVDLSKGDEAAGAVTVLNRSLANRLQVGAEFAVEVPNGMHVTEYATSKTTGVLSTFRILPESDPFYLGNFACDRSWDRVTASFSPAGEALTYCHSTPPRSFYKDENEYRLANNHIEVATDTNRATAENYERISISIFDQDFEFRAARSRFYSMCSRSEIRTMEVPMVNDFFAGRNPDSVRFSYCDVSLPGNGGSPEVWRVGAFTDRPFDWSGQQTRALPSVEMSYMSRANAGIFEGSAFAKTVQTRILAILTKVRP